jgi:two-component system chemotaxis response regulator CheB
MTPLTVKVAEHGELLRPDTVYIAPGEAHLCCRKSISGRATVELTSERAAHAGWPAVDPMFSAMAGVYGAGALGVVLTGMGRDGTAGARRIVAEGGRILAQDRASCVVWGMPGSVARAGLVSALASPEGIAALIHGQMLVAA